MVLNVNLGEKSYDIVVERNSIDHIEDYIDLNRKVMIITDDGVPEIYSKKVADKCKNAYIYKVSSGEGSKSIKVYEEIQKKLLSLSFSRKDAIIAVGGGVVGDLSAFVASSYMRGIDFYNIPTTILSQLDSSIGGKCALNLDGVKNVVGAFYQPKKVIIDAETLKTLPKRQISNGLAEGVKMALTSSAELFEIFENKDALENIDDIIIKSLLIKKEVVEKDEKELGLRKVLNFGHTIGHAIESEENLNKLLHGECVALGILPMVDVSIVNRVKKVLLKLNLPTKVLIDTKKAVSLIKHDKKSKGDFVSIVFVSKIGEFSFKDVLIDELESYFDLIKE